MMQGQAARGRRRGRLQFGLLSLIVLTTLVAGALAVLRPLNLPGWLHAALAAYAILLAVYIAFRGLQLWQRSRRELRQLHQRRQQLQEWTRQQRRASSGEPGPAVEQAPGPTTDREPRL